MHIYTCYSESHRELLDRFWVPSLPPGSEFTATMISQACPSGDYHSANWAVAMREKVRVIISAIENEISRGMDRVFLFCDVDLIFASDFTADLQERMTHFDILTADDDDRHCTGFMGIRATDRTLQAWRWVERRVNRAKCDQIAFQQFVRFQEKPTWFDRFERFVRDHRQDPLARPEPVRIGLLPGDQYANYFHLHQSERCWNGEAELDISPERLARIRVFHANFTVGMGRKIALLAKLQRLLRQPGSLKSS
jgi:hypothetical protein